MPRKALFVNAICLLSLIPMIKGADPNYLVIECPNTNLSTTSTYTPNSTYRTNLNTLLSNLSSNSNASNGFYKSTAGSSPPDVAYGLFLCRSDVSAVVCRDCVVYATGDAVQRCPGSKQVTICFRVAVMQNKEGEYYFGAVISVRKGNAITIGLSVSASVVLVLLGSGIYRQRRRKIIAKDERENIQEVQLLDLAQGRIVDDYSTDNLQGEKPAKSHDFPSLQLDLVLVATKHFFEENKLGEGGFGPVYKGTLPDGKEIAVKRLSRNSGQGLQEFKNEISLIARLQHRNLVRLLGCCLEGNELMLIYEYMPNKSLDFFLFGIDSLLSCH
ncbi:hypothetical protein RHMOL_Rhmol13G0210100 [Rhododendron molle]|uniref:Uncharacterized protein n=1 Tax=Rhododendron molle TaxID=49168 RepID=A0ACC0L915_RHOML|nr:hypothetical protein RHMOL_Rhmol13G0210100 [Rhododendron molle]